MKYSKLKTILFSISAIGLFFIFMEASLRVIYYQKSEPEPLCVMKVYKNLRKGYLQRAAQKKAGDMAFSKDHLRFLYSEVGKDLLAELKTRYEDEFKKLRDELSKDNVHLVMLYLPHYAYWNTHMPDSREFFKGLAERSGVDFIDMTDELLYYGIEQVTLLPEDHHLSRFGNQIIARRLSGYLKDLESHRSALKFHERPVLLGDERPGFHDLSPWDKRMPFILRTNAQGLRMDYDLAFPKTQQRVLVLGDSYTFGPYLENAHTFPAILDRKLEHAEVINAGHGGYTISHESSLYFERAQYSEPDIVVLQVLDNDLEGLVYIHENQYDRHGKARTPTTAERAFLEQAIRLDNKKAQPLTGPGF